MTLEGPSVGATIILVAPTGATTKGQLLKRLPLLNFIRVKISLYTKGVGMVFDKLTIRDVPLDNQTVLVRADYNVPLKENGQIDDDLRIKASLPTLEYLIERKCRIVIISHLGRPSAGQRRQDKSLSLEPVAVRLSKLLKRDIKFVDDCIGDKVYQAVKKSPKNSIILLENLRFYKEEEANSEEFAGKLAKSSTAKYFVQDGFGVVHRAHASTEAITLYLPSVAGLLVEKEYNEITSAIHSPTRPLVAVLGGAKVSDKISVVKRFVKLADRIIIGGAMANTFLARRGISVGASKIETDQYGMVDEIYELARAKGDDFIVLPIDLAIASDTTKNTPRHVVGLGEIDAESKALDIGDRSIEEMIEIIDTAKTVIWNGTLGMAELPNLAHGSARLALELASNPDIKSIIGGGDTADFVLKWDGHDGKGFSHISTGGGASLDLMAGKKLPGVESLLDA